MHRERGKDKRRDLSGVRTSSDDKRSLDNERIDPHYPEFNVTCQARRANITFLHKLCLSIASTLAAYGRWQLWKKCP